MGEVERGLPFGPMPRGGRVGAAFPQPPGAAPSCPSFSRPRAQGRTGSGRADLGPRAPGVGAAGAGGGVRGGRRCPCGAAPGAHLCTPGGRRGASGSDTWSGGSAHHVVSGSAQVSRPGRVGQRRRVTALRAKGRGRPLPPAPLPACPRRRGGSRAPSGPRRRGDAAGGPASGQVSAERVRAAALV